MTRRGAEAFEVDDIEWEDPPSGTRGRAASPENQALVDVVLKMVPALRQRPGKWAVVEAYDEMKQATSKASWLRKHFADKTETVEGRLVFRAAKQLDQDGGKVYVQLPEEGDE